MIITWTYGAVSQDAQQSHGSNNNWSSLNPFTAEELFLFNLGDDPGDENYYLHEDGTNEIEVESDIQIGPFLLIEGQIAVPGVKFGQIAVPGVKDGQIAVPGVKFGQITTH